MTDKGMHIVRHMADGGTIRSCNTLEIDMQDVLMQLLQPGQPMLIQADNGTLVLRTYIRSWTIIDNDSIRSREITMQRKQDADANSQMQI